MIHGDIDGRLNTFERPSKGFPKAFKLPSKGLKCILRPLNCITTVLDALKWHLKLQFDGVFKRHVHPWNYTCASPNELHELQRTCPCLISLTGTCSSAIVFSSGASATTTYVDMECTRSLPVRFAVSRVVFGIVSSIFCVLLFSLNCVSCFEKRSK